MVGPTSDQFQKRDEVRFGLHYINGNEITYTYLHVKKLKWQFLYFHLNSIIYLSFILINLTITLLIQKFIVI